jgi:hypothetical protein
VMLYQLSYVREQLQIVPGRVVTPHVWDEDRSLA